MNIIAESWLHCMLASHCNDDSGDGDNDPTDFIEDYLRNYYKDDLKAFVPIRNEYDYAYICQVGGLLLNVTRGTDGGKAWKENSRYRTNRNGMHSGFVEASNRMWIAKRHQLLKLDGEVVHIGHSRGGAISQHDQFLLHDHFRWYSKCITFCSPKLANRYGAGLLKGLDHIRLEMPNDFVDDVGADAFNGVHSQRKRIMLPKYYGNDWRRKLLNLIPGFGHAYSTVTEALKAYFYGRRMKKEAEFIDSIKGIAKI